jgi:hypothetical protein
MKEKIKLLYAKADKPAKGKEASEDESAVLKLARERARDGATHWRDNWEEAEADLHFISGKQWPEAIRSEREMDGRPCIVNNVMPSFIDQLIGDQRQNRPAIKISPVDMVRVQRPDTEEGEGEDLRIKSMGGNKDYSLAEAFTGIIKNIEYTCDAESAYDAAYEAAVQSGMGFFRVRSDYSCDDSFEQDVIIEPITNQFSVIFDPSAKKRDYSDANWCLIDGEMERSVFEERYPGAKSDPVGDTSLSGWFAEKTVRISEYYTREAVTKESALLSDGRTVYMDEIEPIVDELLEKGISITRTRNVKAYKVMWRKITGANVLEGPIEIPCSIIPVCPVWGKSLTIKNKTSFMSLIRHSKDAQRMANYWDSSATESVALAPKAPFKGTPDQIEGYERDWEQANKKNIGILRYNPGYAGDGGPIREQPAAVPAAEITLSMNSTDKIKSTMGMYDASIGAQGNESSGRAIIARQKQGDRGSFAFSDNLNKAIRKCGKILVELIPKVYDTERVMRVKFQDETEDYVKLNEQIMDDESGEWVTINDLSVAKYDVVVSAGPSYATQRMEAAETMIQFAQAVPNAAAVMGDLIALNMDWPGADSIAERLRKILPPNVLTKEERKELEGDTPEQQGPTPEQQLAAKELDVKAAEADAKAAKAQADSLKAQLETDDAKRKLAMIEQVSTGGSVPMQQIKEVVAQAISELLAQDGGTPQQNQ